MYYTVIALNCTFESGWCGYTQDQKDDFDWSRTNISSPTIGTGPDRDHTTGHGDLILPFLEFIIKRVSCLRYISH